MAITKLMNIKQGKAGGSRHLLNSIQYVMNEKKTAGGSLIGGNSGSVPGEVYRTMMDTKADWEKPDGRQGYHFVISWEPGETGEQTAFEVVKEFCEEYLGDNYDYVFSIHNDKGHMHGHIVFNSVNRISGYKYRYVKGDWEKYIQPVTNRICVSHGLKPLMFEEQRKGRSYAQWAAEKNGKPNWKKIIRADIDAAIRVSKTEEDFLVHMKKQGYELRKGYSEKRGCWYISLRPPGRERARRSYNLGEGYDYEDIVERIRTREKYHYYKQMPRVKAAKFSSGNQKMVLSGFQKRYLEKWYIVTYRHRFVNNPYELDQANIRKELLQIDRLAQECRYLTVENISSIEQLEERERYLTHREKELTNQKYNTDFLQEEKQMLRYQTLLTALENIPEWDDRFEEILDELEQLEGQMPDELVHERKLQQDISNQLLKIRDEKRLIRHIRNNQEDTKILIAAWSSGKRKEKAEWQKKEKMKEYPQKKQKPISRGKL